MKNILYALLPLFVCLSSYFHASGHAGVGVVVKDGCDRYLAIGTWHDNISELDNTINSTRGIYIDINQDGSFVNCCNGTPSSEFFIFKDYFLPYYKVNWNLITSGSSTMNELVQYFNNSPVYNSAKLKNRFTAEKVWNPGCSQNSLKSWVILKLPSSLKPGTTYNCRTSNTSVVERPCNHQAIFQIKFGSDISIIGDTSMCELDSINLTSSAAQDLEWFKNGVLIQGPSSDNTLTISQSGKYTVRKGGTGCQSRTSEIHEVSLHPQPKAHFSIDDSLECLRDHEIIAINKSTLAQGTIKSKTWTTESTDYLDLDTLKQVYSSANDYSIQLKIESDKGCFDSLTKDVTIYPMPEAQFTLDTNQLCERGNIFSIDYQGLISNGAIRKLWDFGDGLTSTTADDTSKSYDTFGSYTIRLELVSDFDCRDTMEKVLTIHPQPKAHFSIDDSLECLRDHEIIAINKSTLAQGTIKSKTWTTESTDYLDLDTLKQVYSSANDYSIQLKIESDKGCFDSLTKDVTIYPMPEAQFTLDTLEQSCFEFQFINTTTGGEIQPYWTIKNTDLSSTNYIEDNPNHRLDKLVDSVFACLKVSDKNGCSDTICLAFPNKFKESLKIYNVFTPNNDGYNDKYFVDIEGSSEFILHIYNRWGDLIFYSEDPEIGWNGKFKNSGNTLPEGTYFYVLKYQMLCTEKQEQISGIIELIR